MGKRVLKPELRKTILAFDVFEKWGIYAVWDHYPLLAEERVTF